MEPAPGAPGHHAAADRRVRPTDAVPLHLSAPLPNRELAAPRTVGDYDVTEVGVTAVPCWWSKTASQDRQDTARVWSRRGFPTVAGCRTGRSSRRTQPAQTAAPQLMQMPTAGVGGRSLMAQSRQFTMMLPFAIRSLVTPAGRRLRRRRLLASARACRQAGRARTGISGPAPMTSQLMPERTSVEQKRR
jgi:hypothetical protein